MLVLSRKKSQSLMVDDGLEIIIIDIKSDQVKIGIRASNNVKVYRKEVYDKIKQEMKEAAKSKIPKIDNDTSSNETTST